MLKFLFLLFITFSAWPLEVPALTSPVIDQANFLDTCEEEHLSNLLVSLNKKTEIQLQLLTISSLEGEVIENYSIKVTDAWKLGDEKEDKGLLFLISKNDKKMRIEVGQGLEGDIPDMRAKRILDEVGVYFRSSNFYGGIHHAFSRIIKLSAPDFQTTGSYNSSEHCAGFSPTGIAYSDNQMRLDDWIPFIIFLLIFLHILFSIFRSRNKNTRSLRGRRRNPFDNDHWGSGGGFGGFGGGSSGGFGGGWSGGGGGFSGGGASGGW